MSKGIRFSRGLRQRLYFLTAGNAVLLLAIALLLKKGASFSEVLLRAGPDVAATALASLGMTGLIYTGALDLSIGSIIAVAGTLFGILAERGFSPGICFAVCIASAWGLSLLNGLLVRFLGISSIIVTLAGLPFYRGVALILAELGIPNYGGNISIEADAYHWPGNNYAGCILLAATLLALLWEFKGKQPRTWLALGNSEEACRLLGLNPGRILIGAFAAGGFFLGLSALVFVTRIQSIEPARLALGFELQVIAAVILGGANIFGGEGSFIGSVLGAFFLYLITQLLIYAGASAYFQEAITGAIILLVIGADCALHSKQKRMTELA